MFSSLHVFFINTARRPLTTTESCVGYLHICDLFNPFFQYTWYVADVYDEWQEGRIIVQFQDNNLKRREKWFEISVPYKYHEENTTTEKYNASENSVYAAEYAGKADSEERIRFEESDVPREGSGIDKITSSDEVLGTDITNTAKKANTESANIRENASTTVNSEGGWHSDVENETTEREGCMEKNHPTINRSQSSEELPLTNDRLTLEDDNLFEEARKQSPGRYSANVKYADKERGWRWLF